MKSSSELCALTIAILLCKLDCVTSNKLSVHEYSSSSASARATQRKAGEVVIDMLSVTMLRPGPSTLSCALCLCRKTTPIQ